jgi:hypothetical protein
VNNNNNYRVRQQPFNVFGSLLSKPNKQRHHRVHDFHDNTHLPTKVSTRHKIISMVAGGDQSFIILDDGCEEHKYVNITTLF